MQERFAYSMQFTPASKWDPNDTGFVIECRDLPELVSQAETEDEAVAQASNALEAAIEFRVRLGEDIPEPSRPRKGERVVGIAPLLAAKAALALALREAGTSTSELARRLGTDEKDVRRLLDPRHGSKLPALDAAMRALGKQLTIGVRDAA